MRGFALDQLGSASVLDQNGVSNGGNGLVVFNAELRLPIWKKKSLGGVGFIDTGNVFATMGDIDLAQLRTAVGFGAQWKSPVGPLRLDCAREAPYVTVANGSREEASRGTSPSDRRSGDQNPKFQKIKTEAKTE